MAIELEQPRIDLFKTSRNCSIYPQANKVTLALLLYLTVLLSESVMAVYKSFCCYDYNYVAHVYVISCTGVYIYVLFMVINGFSLHTRSACNHFQTCKSKPHIS